MLSKNDIKYLRSLGLSKFREQRGQFIAEGSKVINEFHAEGWKIFRLYATEQNGLSTDLRAETVTRKELERISQLNHPQDSLAVIDARIFNVELAVKDLGDLVVLCDHIQDPGNMGTIIRTADWFGIKHVVCSTDCAEAFSPKVVQASMGSLARVEVRRMDLTGFIEKMRSGKCQHKVIVTSLKGSDLYSTGLPQKCFLVLGNESQGVGVGLDKLADARLKIPSSGKAESLNVAVSSGILMAEFRRLNPQR